MGKVKLACVILAATIAAGCAESLPEPPGRGMCLGAYCAPIGVNPGWQKPAIEYPIEVSLEVADG